MSSTDVINDAASTGRTTLDMRLEVMVIAVSDVDRAKDFYQRAGWRLDADFATGPDFRVIQLTPPGSPAAVIFGTGVTAAVPGSGEPAVLSVDDVEAARAELVARGIEVGEVFHDAGGVFHHAGTTDRVPGPDPERRSYCSWAEFRDPDGNPWLLQEITTRLPGRVTPTSVGTLAELLHDTAAHHDAFEKSTPPHDWWDWYAPYLSAREQGATEDEATEAADRYMREVHGITRR
jgi:catechol 2,3-dioxygenase-like lactoylglutathione lyase family enzyme